MKHDSRSNDNSPRSGRVLHVGAPNIGDRTVFDQLVDEMFEQRWFTNNGPLVKKLEDQLCDYLGVKHCIAICNATTGLQLVCRALDLTGEVILPAFTFVATPHAIFWGGLKPVFADVNLSTHSLCAESVLPLINDRTSAIFGVHLWGQPCEIEKLQTVADDHDLKLVFDAAHAFGCSHQGRMIGNFGNCEVFSFHATKFFNTFEGGAIATNDDELAEKIRLMKNFGFSGLDGVVEIGVNAKMSEVSAAMGLSMFGKIDQFVDKNMQNHLLYESILSEVPGIELFPLDTLERTNGQYVVAVIDEVKFGATRDEVHQCLHRNNVLAKRYFHPGCHQVPPYRDEFLAENRRLPNTDELCQRVLCLPTGSTIRPEEIVEVCQLVKSFSAHSIGQNPFISRKAAG